MTDTTEARAAMNPEIVEVTQEDREAAALFASFAWHLFWPNDYQRAMEDAKDMRAGRCDNWHLVQAFARHRHAALTAVRAALMEEAAGVAYDYITDGELAREVATAIRAAVKP